MIHFLLGWFACFLMFLPVLIALRNKKPIVKIVKEQTEKTGVGDFLRFAFPIIRRSYPSLIAEDLISVQPMSSPVGLGFMLDYQDRQRARLQEPLRQARRSDGQWVRSNRSVVQELVADCRAQHRRAAAIPFDFPNLAGGSNETFACGHPVAGSGVGWGNKYGCVYDSTKPCPSCRAKGKY